MKWEVVVPTFSRPCSEELLRISASSNMRKQRKSNTNKQSSRPKPKGQKRKQLVNRSTIKGKGPYKFGVGFNWPSVGLNGNLSGSGPYRAASSSSAVTVAQVPSMHSSGDGFIIRHREYLGDLLSSQVFANNSFRINPGDNTTFPWLAPIAQKFEEFKFLGLAFEFRSTSANALNSVNTALGTVIAAVEYNVSNASFTTKLQMENSMWAVSSKPCESLIMPVECDSRVNPLGVMYVRSGQPVADPRFYDLGTMQFATYGQQLANVNIGELWITYEVALFKPIIVPQVPVIAPSANHFRGSAAVQAIPYNQINIVTAPMASVTCDGVNVVTIAPRSAGIYHLSYSLTGSIATGVFANLTFVLSGGAAYYTCLQNSTTSAAQAVTTTRIVWDLFVSVPDTNVPCTIQNTDPSTYPTGVVIWDLVVTLLQPAFG